MSVCSVLRRPNAETFFDCAKVLPLPLPDQ
jgi:hypothetical protein